MEEITNNSKRFVNIDGFMAYTNLGRNRATELGKETDIIRLKKSRPIF